MPIYEYRCESCGEVIEKIQKVSDAPLKDCPACGKPALKKLVSASSFRLKGSGWYETDFKGKKKPAKDDGGDGAASGDSSADNSDKKGGDSGKKGNDTPSGKDGGSKKTGSD
jgi:putative FmdB family regulatory protein